MRQCEKDAVSKLKRKLRTLKLGHEGSLDFSYGYIEALSGCGSVSRKFANEMLANFARHDEGEEYWDDVKQKYGRVLA